MIYSTCVEALVRSLRDLKFVLVEAAHVLGVQLLGKPRTPGALPPLLKRNLHLIHLIVNEALMVIEKLSKHGYEVASLFIIVRINSETPLKVKRVVLPALGSVFFVVDACVSII